MQMTALNRRAQRPITIRSDRAAARLAQLTSNGRSQAEVIEEALDRMPEPEERAAKDVATRIAELKRIISRVDKSLVPTMREFDAREYDENGNLR